MIMSRNLAKGKGNGKYFAIYEHILFASKLFRVIYRYQRFFK